MRRHEAELDSDVVLSDPTSLPKSPRCCIHDWSNPVDNRRSDPHAAAPTVPTTRQARGSHDYVSWPASRSRASWAAFGAEQACYSACRKISRA